MKTGRPRTCDCGSCKKCLHRDKARAAYQALTLEERREVIAKRDKEKSRAADRARYYRNHEDRKARMREWAEKNREKAYTAAREHYYRYPEKSKARYTMSNAIRDGKLERKPCEKCGDPKSHGHHFDYTKPLEVVWLCATHHGEVHRQYPSTLNVEKAA